jgi:hypothetical protein
MLSNDLGESILDDFLKFSWSSIEAIVRGLTDYKTERRLDVSLFCFKNGRKNDVSIDVNRFFLRSSVEYSNPQLTVEEVQGIIAARLLEACGNYFSEYGLHKVDARDITQIRETLRKPPAGKIMPFLLNTDDIEADRYSMNPLRESIVSSGQSAFPCWSMKTENLKIDRNFTKKYTGALICETEIDRIEKHLGSYDKYMDMVDAVKYEHLEELSESFGIYLCLYSTRMPLTMIEKETPDDVLHYIIRNTHASDQSIGGVYKCMGRSVKNLTTLLSVPHSQKGYASKRAARGRIYIEGGKLGKIKVEYKKALLYPNAIDPDDTSVATAEDNFEVEGKRFFEYDFRQTPSSPQFFLYSLASPENAALWHGIGAFGASELVKSYATIRQACSTDQLIGNLNEKYAVSLEVPVQFSLVPQHMWFHPVHRNIDASIGCINDLEALAHLGMRVEHLPSHQFTRDYVQKKD